MLSELNFIGTPSYSTKSTPPNSVFMLPINQLVTWTTELLELTQKQMVKSQNQTIMVIIFLWYEFSYSIILSIVKSRDQIIFLPWSLPQQMPRNQ